MASAATGGAAPSRTSWTPARIFMAASAAYHLLLGVAGVAIDQTFPIGADATAHAGSDHVFGIFETNGWHSSAALLIGFISLYFTLRPARVREGALFVGISQLAVVVTFALMSPATFWFASNGADQVIHAITAFGGIGSAVLTRSLQQIRS